MLVVATTDSTHFRTYSAALKTGIAITKSASQVPFSWAPEASSFWVLKYASNCEYSNLILFSKEGISDFGMSRRDKIPRNFNRLRKTLKAISS
jgi:hypothetical protein